MIFSADLVLTVTSDPINNAAVLARDGIIAAIGPREEIIAKNPEDEEVHFNDSLIMPGLVNLHGHIECSSFDYLAKPSTFSNWLGGIISASSKLDRDAWLDASRKGVKRYLEAGITCTADITRSGTGIQALLETGMPAVVFFEAVAIDRKNMAEAVVYILEQIKSMQSMSDKVWLKVGLSPHSSYTLSDQALKVCAEIAEQYELPLTIHLSETREENELIKKGSGLLADRIGERLEIEAVQDGASGKTPAEYLCEKGLLQKGLIAAHGVWLSDTDIELLKKQGAAVSVCPTSNELLNAGKPAVGKFIKHGLQFGIGTDSAASNPEMDLFSDAGKIAGSKMITAKQIIEKITIEAAKLLSLDEYVGSIETGKRADMVIIDYPESDRNENEGKNPYTYILNSVKKSSVRSTVLGGEIVYKRV